VRERRKIEVSERNERERSRRDFHEPYSSSFRGQASLPLPAIQPPNTLPRPLRRRRSSPEHRLPSPRLNLIHHHRFSPVSYTSSTSHLLINLLQPSGRLLQHPFQPLPSRQQLPSVLLQISLRERGFRRREERSREGGKSRGRGVGRVVRARGRVKRRDGVGLLLVG